MDLQRGSSLLIRQFIALLKKNFLLSWRNKRETFLRLFSSLFLLFLIDKSMFGTVAPSFFLSISMFGFVFQIRSLITEKELKLRQAMTMMGLYDSAFWLSCLAWEGILTLISSLFTILFGMMLQFDFFLNNSFLVIFLLVFLFQLNMVGFAFMLSSFISKSSSTTYVGFFIFLVGNLTQLVTISGFPYGFYQIIWSLFPPNLLAEALILLADATPTPQDPGISWSRRAECAPNNLECVITMNDIYIWLTATFFLWFLLAIYLDNIIPNSAGVRKNLFYFLKPGYWTGRGGNRVEEGGNCNCIGSVPSLEDITPDDEDALEEETIIKEQRRVTSGFGASYFARVSFTGSTNGNTHPNEEAVKQFFKYHLDVVPKEENKAFLAFDIPQDREAILPEFFGELQDRKTEFGIADIELGFTTLKEVFTDIAQKAEQETAVAAEGSMESLNLASGLVVQVPVGARFVGIPGTESAENPRGVMVEVHWEQDDNGLLCISGYSPETPVPPSIPPMPALRRRSRTVKGVVIDHPK